MKIFAKRKKSSLPPVVSTPAMVTGWYPRSSDGILYPRTVIPLVDELSCIPPTYKYNNSISILSSGWYAGLTFPYYNNDLTYTPDLSHGNRNIAWRQLVSNTKGRTNVNTSATIRILEYPGKPNYNSGSMYGLTTPYTGDAYLLPMTPDFLNQPNTSYNIAFSSMEQSFTRDIFSNIRDSVSNKSLYPQPLSSLWFQNGLPIPNTENIFSYTPTTDNIILQFSISAQNYNGMTVFTGEPKFIKQGGYKYAENAAQTILQRTTNQPGGSASMNMFTVKNHNTKTYTRNPNLWCKGNESLVDLSPQFTGCAVYKTFAYESYGGVLITPRHVLYCQHAHPQAKGTWSPGLNQSCDLTFVTSNNIAISCTQLHQASNISADLAVGLLDRNMEDLGLHVSPILQLKHSPIKWGLDNNSSYTDSFYSFMGQTCLATTGIYMPWVAVSQGALRPTTSIPPVPASNYPQQNDIMLHIAPQTYGHPLSSFRYNVWDGDSGTPVFTIIYNTVYLSGIMVSSPWGFRLTDTSTINQLITAADANAIAMGRLTEQTGYQVNSFNLSALPSINNILQPNGINTYLQPDGINTYTIN
jgi:hypothetical protein